MPREIDGLYPTEQHNAAVAKAVRLAEQYPDAKAFVIVDFDDVVDRTWQYMDTAFRSMLRDRYHGFDRFKIPSRRKVRKSGLKAAYADLFGGEDIYVERFHEIEREPEYLQRLRLLDRKLPERLKALADAGYPVILGLSARSEELMEESRDRLEALGITIGVYTQYPQNGDVIGMKIGIIQNLANALPGKHLVMIDDNPRFIHELNAMDDSRITGVQFAEQPFFPNFLRRGASLVSSHLQTDWQHVHPTLEAAIGGV